MKDCLQPCMQESPEAGLGAARQRWVPDVAPPSQQQHWRLWSCTSRVMGSARRQDNLVPSALWANREWKSLFIYGTGAVTKKEIMRAAFFPCISSLAAPAPAVLQSGTESMGSASSTTGTENGSLFLLWVFFLFGLSEFFFFIEFHHE